MTAEEKHTEKMMEDWDELVSKPLPIKISAEVEMQSGIPALDTAVQTDFKEPKKKKKIKSSTIDIKKRNNSSLFE